MQACMKVKYEYVSLFLEVLSGTLCTAINVFKWQLLFVTLRRHSAERVDGQWSGLL